LAKDLEHLGLACLDSVWVFEELHDPEFTFFSTISMSICGSFPTDVYIVAEITYLNSFEVSIL
jgi:hypothetical protein